MNCKRTLALFVTMAVLLLGVGQVTGQQAGPQNPQGTYGYAFTYQGQLQDAGGPVNGTCDLRFILWNAASGGSQVGSTLTLEGVEIEDGLFTARLDFGGWRPRWQRPLAGGRRALPGGASATTCPSTRARS